jgi:DNA-binding FadR family transcriptional regulator
MVVEMGSLQYAMVAIASDNSLYEKLIAICDTLDKTKDAELFLEGDTEFHRVLVEASGVHPLMVFNDVISAFFKKFRLELLNTSDSARLRGSQVHRDIVNALHEHRLIDAETAMRNHLAVFTDAPTEKVIRK